MPAGGRRPGAGRKPNALRKITEAIAELPKFEAKRFFADIRGAERLKHLVEHGSEPTQRAILLDALDRAYGKPATTLTHEGQVDVKVIIDL